jgi:hypothetical protein
VPIGLRDELVPAWFDRDNLVAIGTVGGGLGRCHGYTMDTTVPGRNRNGSIDLVSGRPAKRMEDAEAGRGAQKAASIIELLIRDATIANGTTSDAPTAPL